MMEQAGFGYRLETGQIRFSRTTVLACSKDSAVSGVEPLTALLTADSHNRFIVRNNYSYVGEVLK